MGFIATLGTIATAITSIVSILKGITDVVELLGPLLPLIGSVLSVVLIAVVAIVLSIILLPLAPFILLAAVILIMILLAIGILLTILVALVVAAWHALTALPLFLLARKMKCKHAWLVWLPIPLVYDYVLFTAPGKRPFCLFGKKLAIKDRWIPWLLYLAGPFVNMFLSPIPYVGALLATVYGFFCLYLYALALKDIVCQVREGFGGNLLASLLAVVADNYLFLNLSIAPSILLYMVCGKPLLPEAEEPVAGPVPVPAPVMPATPVPAEIPESAEIIVQAEEIVVEAEAIIE